MAGLWEFPGGKVNPGEWLEDGLVRELHEELGITVATDCLAPLSFASHIYDAHYLLLPLFICRKWSGIVTPREGQTLKWVDARRLRGYNMPAADAPLVAHLRDLLS